MSNSPIKRRAYLGLARRLAVVLFTVWLALTGLATWMSTHRLDARHTEPAPNVKWATVESQRIKTSDGQELGGWLFRPSRTTPAEESPSASKGVVLVLHGISNSRSGMLPLCRKLVADGYTVLAITLRAHGDSTGTLIDIGWSSQHDVVAGVDLLEQKCPGQPIYIVGRSLGAASAVYAAKALGNRVSGYLLEEPYKDLDSAVWNRVDNALPRGLDWIAYRGMRLWSPLFLPVNADEISPYKHIVDIPTNVPVVLLAGSVDRNARQDDVRQLYELIKEHAKFIVFDGANHEALDMKDGKLYQTAIDAAFGAKKDQKPNMKTEKSGQKNEEPTARR